MNKKNIVTSLIVLLFAFLLLAPIFAQEKPANNKNATVEKQQVCKDECKTMEKCSDKAKCESCTDSPKNCGDSCKMNKCNKSKSDSKCAKKCDTTTEKSEKTMNSGTVTK